ncbi:CdaR family protein [Bacteroides sp. 224]|uniref:CdaR family protein n=1 Tax=Bacteroides sp. 224 TaxID=2302936 RepID=UPI0013D72C24|nr:YbbR-like domain-containing protein [Bacteroides sp. 224]NDV64814.1 YbbR-like domain-containing protein [Bacteroides sp. 224]
MFDRRNIKNTYLKILKRTKDFLLSKKSREFFVFLFFFFVSGAFWLLQTLNDDYETELSLPVRLKNVPENVIITTEPPAQLQIRVKDKGNVLMNYMVSKNFFPVNLDFKDYQGSGNYVRIQSSDFEKRILSQMNASTRLLSVKPDTLEYIYSTGKSKQIPVRIKGKVTAGREYYISDTICNPDSVLVYGPPTLLDTIKTAYTSHFEINDISDTIKQQIPLQTIKGAKFIPDQVEVILPVDMYTEKVVEVPITGVDFPSNKTLRTFPSKVKVTFQIGLSRFKEIDADDFTINVSYNHLMHLTTEKYSVKLTDTPRGVSHIRITPEQVDFLIEETSIDDN